MNISPAVAADICKRIAAELAVAEERVAKAIELLDGGNTVPFIARYRKEATGFLDDGQLRQIERRRSYLQQLEERREAILTTLADQQKLTPELEAAIRNAPDKTQLEDLYAPYVQRRHTRAATAREHGLEPLADLILAEPSREPSELTAPFINEKVADAAAALEGARHILLEKLAEPADLLERLRQRFWADGLLRSQLIEGKEAVGEKFRDYFSYEEAIAKVPSHRALALFRGRNEEVLNLSVEVPREDYEELIAAHFHIPATASPWLRQTIRLCWRAKIGLKLELEAMNRLKEQADRAAIAVFAGNLQDLLLAAPAGSVPILGLDPGYRNGVKCAAIDGTGKLLATAIVYLHREDHFLDTLGQLIRAHGIKLLAIGNGTASRETGQLVGRLLADFPGVQKITISEAGASIYSASELAAAEFPQLDVSLRGAVSIARRLQDPLAELVKIEPKSIGVGQYQHDVDENLLEQSLNDVVEDCVNKVGVDVNLASVQLLQRVAGLSPKLASNIVAYRDDRGPFPTLRELLQVPALGPVRFKQAAGFLRVVGEEPLDNSAVHPESYQLVKQIAKDYQLPLTELIGNGAAIKKIDCHRFATADFGALSVREVLRELARAGRDPRGEFKSAAFQEDINDIKDLQPGLVLEGVVSNVAQFGVFVDIGVHQDGLVHVSQLADHFVKDPRDVVKAGDFVRVRVLEVDVPRKRISLSMVLEEKKAKENKGKGEKKATSLAAAFGDLRR